MGGTLIIDRYVYENGLRELDGVEVFDFLPYIREGSRQDNRVLDKWRRYFNEIGVPYVVIQTKKGLRGDPALVLWKKWVVPLDGPTCILEIIKPEVVDERRHNHLLNLLEAKGV